MESSTRVTDGRAVITLQGRFDFSACRDFRNLCSPPLAADGIAELELDFESVDHLDGSALGMLLFLKERADGLDKRVILSRCRGAVKRALEAVNLDGLFDAP